MKEWFDSLDPRERVMVCAAGVVIVLAIIYLAVWQPLNNSVNHLHKQVQQEKQLVAWLKGNEPRVRALRSGHRHGGQKAQGKSLLTVIDSTRKKAGLASAVKRIQPQGDQLVRVWIKNATFNDVIGWLDSLSTQYGVSIKSISLEPADQMGRVDGNIRLYRAQGSGT